MDKEIHFHVGQRVRFAGSPDTPQTRGRIIGAGWQAAERDRVTERTGDLRPLFLVLLEDGAYLEGRAAFVSVLCIAPSNLEPNPNAVGEDEPDTLASLGMSERDFLDVDAFNREQRGEA